MTNLRDVSNKLKRISHYRNANKNMRYLYIMDHFFFILFFLINFFFLWDNVLKMTMVGAGEDVE